MCIILAVGVLTGVEALAAEPAEARDLERARLEFDVATGLFEAGEFAGALSHFRSSYELSQGRPSVLFMLAQCERNLELYEQALVHLQDYLRSEPEEAHEVQKTIETLKQLIADRDRAPNGLGSWIWVAGGVAVAGAATGLTFGFLAKSAAGVSPFDDRYSLDRARADATLANVGLGVACAAIVGGVAFWLLDGSGS